MRQIFPVGVPVVGENLIGREKEIEEIQGLLKIGQSVIITAPRKYGKTSLILEILNRLRREGFLVGSVDVFGVVTKGQLAEKIVEAVLSNRRLSHTVRRLKEGLVKAMKQIEIKQAVQDYEFILGFADSRADEDALLDEALDFPEKFAQRSGRPLFFAFDEFGDIYKMNGEALIKKMRSKFQLHRHATYMFSGSQESLMNELFAQKRSAFFRFGRIFYLSELPPEDLKLYIARTFQTEGIQIGEEVLEGIVSRTCAHPYYTQLVCQLCYLDVKNAKEEVSLDDVIRAHQKAILFEKSYFEEVWTGLMSNRYQLLLLRQILIEGGSPYRLPGLDKQYIYKLLVGLEKKGVIRRVGKGRYDLVDPLFRDYLRLREEEKI